MSMSDQNKTQPRGGEKGSGTTTGTVAAPQTADASSSDVGEERGARHGRRRRGGGGGGRPEQRQPQAPQRRSESTLNMDELRELTELFTTHNLTDFEFENADIRIRLSRNPAPASAAPSTHAPNPLTAMQSASGAHAVGAAAPGGESAPQAAAEVAEEELHIITSPIVGTFYRAASPTAESFVRVGSQVEPDMVVCIIEAMKLMNEIQAETTGTIAKIYVENGQPVEYGQPLFGVKK
ncbi:MAG: acetyl-CoA carboxylase biotin carboxyl carrier protein [Acidobacteriota bacterium]|jgi:acetyl-CoA carboxylase biotin carboxyl carrier protein|nr:acetyl-CoA carboxylase biotin carboxyl carrier protein [Acidobacteriota bacterium]